MHDERDLPERLVQEARAVVRDGELPGGLEGHRAGRRDHGVQRAHAGVERGDRPLVEQVDLLVAGAGGADHLVAALGEEVGDGAADQTARADDEYSQGGHGTAPFGEGTRTRPSMHAAAGWWGGAVQAPVRIQASPRTRSPSVTARATMNSRFVATHSSAVPSGPAGVVTPTAIAPGMTAAAATIPAFAR